MNRSRNRSASQQRARTVSAHRAAPPRAAVVNAPSSQGTADAGGHAAFRMGRSVGHATVTNNFTRSLSGRRAGGDGSTPVVSGAFIRSEGLGFKSSPATVSQTFASSAGGPIAADEGRVQTLGATGVTWGKTSGGPAGGSGGSGGAPGSNDGTIAGMADAMTAALNGMLSKMFGGLKK